MTRRQTVELQKLVREFKQSPALKKALDVFLEEVC